MTGLVRPYWIAAEFRRDEGWDDGVYPFNLPVVNRTDRIDFHPRVTFLVGENGSGKSTLIEALAVAWGFNPEGGSKDHRFATHDSHSSLHRHIRAIRDAMQPKPHDGFFLRAESFFNVATYLEQAGGSRYGDRPLHQQSHGEAFFSLFENRLTGDGLYIMDEPEAALSPQRQLSFLAKLHQLVLARSQLIIATHSPIILGYPDAWIYQASEHGLERIDYEDTEHYSVTRGFLNRRKTFLKILMEEDEGPAPR
ncbi:MAG TPA: AAA family ATPase [Caulobacter sp.]|nr:AAA family ATPase [Caulobacter sp.]